MDKYKKPVHIYAGFAAFLILIALLSMSDRQDNFFLERASVSEMNSGWKVYVNGEYSENLNLPLRKRVSAGENITAEKILSQEFIYPRYLLIRTSLQEVEIFLDNQLIYETYFDDEIPGLPPASLWHLVEIPGESQGSRILISLNSPFERFSGIVNPVFHGSKGDLYLYIASEYIYVLAVSGIMFLAGVILLVLPLFIKSGYSKNIIYLGIFSVFVSFWLFAESRLMQFFTGNRFLIGGLAYMMIAIIPVPMILYIRQISGVKFRKIYTFFALAFAAVFVFIVSAQLSGLLPFFTSMTISHVLIMILCIVTVILLAYEIIFFKNEGLINFFWSGIFIVAFVVAEVISFHLTRNTRVGDFIILGILVFIFIQGVVFIKKAYLQSMKIHENQLLREMAFRDYLTGGGNRLAFQRDIEEIFANKDKLQRTALFLFDLNDLKTINDIYGHSAGDEAIVFAFRKASEALGEKGKCYRIGGDEIAGIAVLDERDKKNQLESILKNFREALEKKAGQDRKFAHAAAGGVIYSPETDGDIKDLFNRADRMMYKDKRQRKK